MGADNSPHLEFDTADVLSVRQAVGTGAYRGYTAGFAKEARSSEHMHPAPCVCGGLPALLPA